MRKIKFLVLLFTIIVKLGYTANSDSLTISPSPLVTDAIINFQINYSNTITLKIFSNTGQIVRTYFDNVVLPAGSYLLNFEADTLPDGVYFVSLNNISRKIIKTQNAVGIIENKIEKRKIFLYPNPATDMLEMPFEGYKTIIITDLAGKILIYQIIKTKSISLASLVNGNYIVTILSENKQVLAIENIVKVD